MKLFKVYCDDWGYDNYDSVIVAAESEEQIRNNIEQRTQTRSLSFGDAFDDIWFENWQGDIHIEEIKIDEITEPKILVASFNAG